MDNDKSISILLVEDNPGDVGLIQAMLSETRADVKELKHVENLAAAIDCLAKEDIDVVLLDLTLPDSHGLETLDRLIVVKPGVAVIVLTGFDDEEVAVKAVTRGAQDYLVKGKVTFQLLTRSILYAVERKRSESALKKSEERYRDLFENANDLIQSTAPDGSFIYVNRAWKETLGYNDEEISRLTVLDIIDPESQSVGRKIFERLIAGEKVDRIEVDFLSKDGGKVIVEGSVNVSYEDERPVSVRCIFHNITERKKVEAEKNKIQGQLLQAQKMEAIGTLAGGVAHDFNNILTAIQGYNELTMRMTDPGTTAFANLTAVRDSCKRAAGIIRQLLFFSRKQPMDFIPININVTVVNLLKMLDRLIGEDIRMSTNLFTDVKSVIGDAGNIEQLLMNLVVNARDAMPEGGELKIITENRDIDEEYCRKVNYARPGSYVYLAVEDSGIGMDAGIIPHIFEPFFTTKEVGKGTGLGLAGVYGIVKQHNGWVNVHSEPGKGTRFVIYLPAIADKGIDAKDNWLQSSEMHHGKGERILLVEDEKDLMELSTIVLEESGYLVFPARSAGEAMEVFKRERGEFDLVFSDVVLPDDSGVKVVEQLLAAKPGLKVLLSSGYTDEKSQWETIRKKEYPFLQKPYMLSDMLQMVKDICGED